MTKKINGAFSALTEAQVEALVSQRTASLLSTDQADGTYLRTILHHTQGKLGPLTRGRPPSIQAQIDALQAVTIPFYAAVLRGVTTEDIAIETGMEADKIAVRTRERNRRATFARSVKSTLVVWVQTGGDLRALNAATVTKTQLQVDIREARSPGDAFERTVERAQRRIIVSIAQQARGSPDMARARLEAIIEALAATLDDLPAVGPLTVVERPGVKFTGRIRRGVRPPRVAAVTAVRRAA